MNILVVVAHMDDETFGMYGTLKKLTNHTNHNVKVISLCIGRESQDRSSRYLAFKHNMELLNIDYKVLGYFDLELYKESPAKIANIIKSEIDSFNPSILFCNAKDLHTEHELINRCTKVAVRNTSVNKLLEIYIPGSSDITQFNAPFISELSDDEVSSKIEACNQYTSEIKDNLKIISSSMGFIGSQHNMNKAELFNIVFDKDNSWL